jgi:hypothetical protein
MSRCVWVPSDHHSILALGRSQSDYKPTYKGFYWHNSIFSIVFYFLRKNLVFPAGFLSSAQRRLQHTPAGFTIGF